MGFHPSHGICEYEVEFPWYAKKNPIERGMPPDTLYNYVNSDFVADLLPHVRPLWVALLQRYAERWENLDWLENTWPTYDEERDKNRTLEWFEHCPDDIIVVGQGEIDWWVFWLDRDVSDCAVGRKRMPELGQEAIVAQIVMQRMHPLDKWIQEISAAVLDHDEVEDIYRLTPCPRKVIV